MRKHTFNNQQGNALITVIFFAAISIIISTTATVIMAVNMLSQTKVQRGVVALSIAESGAENAVLRLLRDPSYTGENDLPIGEGEADITVTGTNPKIIHSTGSIQGFQRSIEVQLGDSGGILTVESWKEIEL